jgi:5-deoxy-D-glucuronate isomerase
MSRFEHIVHSRSFADGRSGELISFSREEARWEWMNFRVTRLDPGEIFESRISPHESQGRATIKSSRGHD